MVAYLSRRKGRLALCILCSVISGGAALLYALLLKNLIDLSLSGKESQYESTLWGSIFFLGAMLIVGYVTKMLWVVLLRRCLLALKNDLFSSLIHRSIPEFNKENNKRI